MVKIKLKEQEIEQLKQDMNQSRWRTQVMPNNSTAEETPKINYLPIQTVNTFMEQSSPVATKQSR